MEPHAKVALCKVIRLKSSIMRSFLYVQHHTWWDQWWFLPWKGL